MSPSEKPRFLALFFACLLLSELLAADFTLRSLSLFANINRDASVNVEERLILIINSTQSRELYEATRATYSDLATWKNRTQLSEMRHHITRAAADITNLRVIPLSVEGCNAFIGICRATVVIDYAVPAGASGSGLVRVERYKPRTARYSLNPDALSFEQTKSGDLVLPTGTNISLSIPAAAEKIYFSSLPHNLEEDIDSFRYDQSANLRYYTGSRRIFTWRGESLSKFQFTYEIESPLESEVIEFFTDSQRRVIQFFVGSEGPAALIILASAVFSAYYFNRLKR